jgi:hypothetical protein
MSQPPTTTQATAALAGFGMGHLCLRAAPDAGLINGTYLVGEGPDAVLQWVNPLFPPAIHLDIALLLERLAAGGMLVPRLLPTRTGDSYLETEHGIFRLWSFIPGRTIHQVSSPRLAAAAGHLVGRFHRVVQGWKPVRHAPVRRVHDTPARMRDLEEEILRSAGHPLADAAGALGQQILERWQGWSGSLEEEEVICHGDLKISNLRFANERDEAIALLDLDTIGPLGLSVELGDAWRSWCNPAGEDQPDAVRFDLPRFEASARAFLAAGPELDPHQRAGLAAGPERICLELAARFCKDALANSYFREDRARFPVLGSHNLARATAQFRLAESARSERGNCERILREG